MVKGNDVSTYVVGQVFAHKLNFIATVLTKKGVSLSTLIKDTGITPEELNDRNYKIHKEQIITFYRNVLALKIPTLSILLAASIKVNDYGLYGCTLLCCKGLRSALEFSVRYHNLATKTVKMSLHVDEISGYSYFRFEDSLFANDLIEFNIELQCVIVLSLVRECLGDTRFAFDELRFTFARPKNYREYEEHFQCPIIYNSSHNEFVLTNHKLSLSTPRSNPFAMPLLLDQCDMVLNSIAAKNEFLITINQWVAANMHKELCSEELASYLCMTPRTLRRKLSEQGTSFRDIVKELRCEAAKKLITSTQLTIEDIGCSIGFSDVSNFRAAFKKWTGKTPSSLR
ncbi:MAG: AraC family transcriptional regulator [Colwellia sp.]|nr:AraC family transcriptional regulator [Colwellia sp.]MCW9083036.1 AraC family transcriptional regulator [Colwellia sp.]